MIEIRLTLDSTQALIGAVRDLAGAIHAVANNAGGVPAGEPCERLTTQAAPVDAHAAPEKDGTAEKAQNLPSEATAETERPDAPAIGDTLSPACACAEPEPAPVADDPAHAEETPTPEPAPVAVHLDGTDPLAGKGQTGEILAELTRTAIGDLDALGVDRSAANRRIRDYCARTDIKFPTFPALLQAVGYAEAIAICKGT